ncbi:MAG: RAMP superfamily CRISPR-associated protein [Nitrospirota bacterium]
MSYDFYCQTISEYSTEVERLAGLETALKEAKNQKDKNEQDRIKKARNHIYDEFYKEHPTLFYQHLKGTGWCDADTFRSYWLENKRKQMPDENFRVKISGFESSIIPEITPNYLSALPEYSFAIQFKFTLEKSYISKDDQEFYIIDNPVKKDWIFEVPMVSPSTWKGHLRWVMRKNNNDDEQIVRLFGHQKEEEKAEEQRRGRLIFFPTFLDMIDVEVINPHDRKTKAGTWPIFIEVVPQNASGTFTLVYVPFDQEESDLKRTQVTDDIKEVVEAVRKLMLEYGFSAKRTSGCGVIKKEVVNGKILLRAFNKKIAQEIETVKEKLELLELPEIIKESDLENGELKPYEKEWNKPKKKKYREKKEAWDDYKNKEKSLKFQLAELESRLRVLEKDFNNLDELPDMINELEAKNER